MVIECDVLIVGAGPAGLSAALQLSVNGFSTIILEKKNTPGSKQTSYDITEGSRIRKILNEMNIKPLKISPISEWLSPNHSYILDSKIEDFYFKRGPERNSIENILLRKLPKKNVTLLIESYIDTLKVEKKAVTELTIKNPDGKTIVKPKYIIGADGAESNLKKKIQTETNIYAIFRGIGVIVKSEKKNKIPHARIYFDEKLAPGGYIYSGSVEDELFYCIVIDDLYSKEIKLRKNLEKFLEQKENRQISVKNYFSGIGASGILKNHNKNVFFVGGAALFHDLFLGYGLNYAIESGYTAAQAIIKNKIALYEKYVNTIQQEIQDMKKIREIWRTADNTFFDRLLLALNGKVNIKDIQINQIIDLLHG